jgi:hypothetical protein
VPSRMAKLMCLFGFLLGLTGCLGYRAGSSLPAGVTSVYVRSFINRTGEPDVETAVTRAAVREFQKDGSLRMASVDEADVIVEATVTDLRLEPLRYSKELATETTEFRLILAADVILKDRKTGKVVATHPNLTGKATFAPGGDLASAKRLAIPPAAKDLAHAVVAAVVEAW